MPRRGFPGSSKLGYRWFKLLDGSPRPRRWWGSGVGVCLLARSASLDPWGPCLRLPLLAWGVYVANEAPICPLKGAKGPFSGAGATLRVLEQVPFHP